MELRSVEVDGSPARVAELVDALAAALDGGPPVLPLPVGARAAATRAPAGTAVVIATSGSTGEPKLVALSAAALRASARATETRLGGAGRWLLALPAEHIAGVQVIVRALLAGAAPAVLDLRAGFRPDGFATTTATLGPGRRYTSLVPTQLRRILDAAEAPGGGGARLQEGHPAATGLEQGAPAAMPGDGAATPPTTALAALRGYAAVLVGGAALDPATREGALAAGVRVVTTYGMSETAGGCVYDGVPLDGVTVDLEPDGRILLGGPTLASGYLIPDVRGAQPNDAGHGRGGAGDDGPSPTRADDGLGDGARPGDDRASDPQPNDNGPGRGEAGDERPSRPGGGAGDERPSTPGGGAGDERPGRPGGRGLAPAGRPGPAAVRGDEPRARHAAEAAFQGGRFRTGDLGRWRDGRLEVLGRADDVIVTGGEKVAPEAVERVLTAQPGVRAACVAALPDPEWGQVVVAAVVWESPAANAALQDAVRAALGRAAVPRRIVAVDAIPLRGIGKPDRAAVARLVSTADEGSHPVR
jgi:acyl-CoA synthetase (AMP-forming)/AMP-acid ligase II